jgi:acetylornithine deacetylase/succinyl-diaminopimelate desuccinylase-like protein
VTPRFRLAGAPLAIALGAALALIATVSASAAPRDTRAKVRAWRSKNEKTILSELTPFLSVPNVSSDHANLRANASRLVMMLGRRGMPARLLEAHGNPNPVYAELVVPDAKHTIGLYAHYDGQPVDPKEWTTPPFTPTLRDAPLDDAGSRAITPAEAKTPFPPDARLYARGASDDKGAIQAILSALDALRSSGILPTVNIKVLFEGEEELGSPHLGDILRRNASLLKADLWLLCDGPVHPSRRQQVVFGARGTTSVELTVYGATATLHSGHYGNWAPNPALQLAHLLASLRDADGRILVSGFAEDALPPSDAEREALTEIPDVDAELRESLGLAESLGARLVESVLSPAINVRGLESGHVGEKATNAIPTEARASLDLRLVPDQTPENARARLEEHLRGRGWRVVSEEPDAATRRRSPRLVRLVWGSGYPPARTPLDSPAARAVTSVLDAGSEKPVLRVPTLGGSIPMYLFTTILKAPALVFPIANHDNNQHAADENLRLQNLWDGIESFGVLFAELGPAFEEK